MNVKTKDKIATGVFYAIAVLIVIILAGLLGYILVKGVPQLSWKFLTTPPQSFQAGGGIGPEIWNSFYMLVITMIISVPISLGAGIYMAEYARKNWITDLIRTTIEVLS
ncbi:phosphate ABC transporter, permease protein PstA, partial [Listeria monocytogenes]|nr:phosphate ABC transporter, permease protein PstA [Listeria monocytogenes]